MPQVIESRTFRTESGYWVCEIPSKDPFLMPSQFAFFSRDMRDRFDEAVKAGKISEARRLYKKFGTVE